MIDDDDDDAIALHFILPSLTNRSEEQWMNHSFTLLTDL